MGSLYYLPTRDKLHRRTGRACDAVPRPAAALCDEARDRAGTEGKALCDSGICNARSKCESKNLLPAPVVVVGRGGRVVL